jgi:competence protein ComEC
MAASIVAAGWVLRRRRVRVLVAVALLGLVLFFVPGRVVRPGWPPEGWAMVDCDVGQGDAEVLATATPGRAVLVDTGPDPAYVEACLDRLGVTRIPLIVFSHLHADHIGGLAGALAGRSVGAIAVGASRVPAWAWDQVRALAAQAHVPVLQLRRGQRLSWPGLSFRVIGPEPEDALATGATDDGTAINNTSVVLLARTRAGTVLLSGDVERQSQLDLLADGAPVRADVLKIPHHGSRYSAEKFLEAVHARIAVASAGKGNPYGHPSPVTLRELHQDGALVLRTDQDGSVAILPGRDGPVALTRGDPLPAPG